MTTDGLTAKEAALIAAARREARAQAATRAAAAPAATAPSPITPSLQRASETMPANEPAAPAGIDVYERIARLIEAERRENERRRARLRRYGTALALLFILPFLTWSMLVLLSAAPLR